MFPFSKQRIIQSAAEPQIRAKGIVRDAGFIKKSEILRLPHRKTSDENQSFVVIFPYIIADICPDLH